MSSPGRDRLLHDLELAIERDRIDNGRWIYVTFDPDTGAPINAGGVYGSEADAYLALTAEAAHDNEGEPLPRKIIPLFVQDDTKAAG